ncbi:NAD(P)H-dependent oxidoreductase [Ligilactobacillus sp. LYQ139]|uniref:NAD(P)H-dependent oxidoreductase n=1 Tax=Ligilactobacillus sp. LYQ139 TaxID=3378800 RepID=UPI0038527E5A
MKTLILAHPYDKSFCHEIFNIIKNHNPELQVIDLYRDGFNPTTSKEELSQYNSGTVMDELVIKYQKLLKQTTDLIIVTPIWWNSIPAILKGFFDKVLSKHFAYEDSSMGVNGNLKNIKKAQIITTSNSPVTYLKINGVNHVLKMTLKQVGVSRIKFTQLGSIKKTTLNDRKHFLNKLINE